MRSPFFIAAFSGFAVIAGCSQPEARADEDLRRDLDLALNGGGHAVVSNLEIAGARNTPMKAPAAPHHEHSATARPQPRPAVEEPVQTTEPVQRAEDSELLPANGGPSEETVAEAADPAPQPAAGKSDPEPVSSTGRGRIGGNFPMPTDIGVSRPGSGGVIVIRGGPGGAEDPCDERDGHGRRIPVIGGGVLINPTFPTAGGGHTGRGGRGGGIFR